jgi:transposase
MWGMLKRHEVETLLKAGHPKTEVARLTGVSLHSVKRMADEAPVAHIDDAVERVKRRIGRPSLVEGFQKLIVEILQAKADLPSLEVLRRVREAGYSGGKTALYALVASLRPKEPTSPSQPSLYKSREEVFHWMRAVLQGALDRAALAKELGNVAELDRLLTGVREGRLPQRNKAMAILAHERGIRQSYICSFLHISNKKAIRCWREYQQGGAAALFAKRVNGRCKSKDDGIKKAVFALLHTPPSAHGINRSTWRLNDLQRVLRDSGVQLSKDVIPAIIKDAGYKWRAARIVLTSKDPQYKPKIEAVKKILSELKSDEAFFSIDEFGPFAVKKTGGRKLVAPEETYIVPQWQKSKGYLIVTGALELSRNQMTHFFSDKKNTLEMIKMMDLLRAQYRDCKTIYLSWDAASWHISKELFAQIQERNDQGPAHGFPIVKTAPLPAGAQFLNVIESVFSGMARAIIHNSDYASLEAAKQAIDKHFTTRNDSFREHPKRAGRKIWGAERVPSEFCESSNCKDPLYR